MEHRERPRLKRIEFLIWMVGVVGILAIIISKSKTAAAGFLNERFYGPILIISMFLLCLSLIMKIKRESIKKRFSIFFYTKDFIRLIVGLGIAIYYLAEGQRL